MRCLADLQFLQVGDDDQAAAFLATLDDDLKSKHGVRDMVRPRE